MLTEWFLPLFLLAYIAGAFTWSMLMRYIPDEPDEE